MQKIERKKLILIIAIIATVFLASIAIVVSMITSGEETPPEKEIIPVPSQNSNVEDNIEQGAPIGNSDDPDAPPSGMYDNDYSDDEGYERLPQDFDPTISPTEGTIYDSEWAYFTYNNLLCELSTKPTASARAVQSIEEFKYDLRRIGEPWATSYMNESSSLIDWYKENEGERVPANQMAELAWSCDTDLELHDHDH